MPLYSKPIELAPSAFSNMAALKPGFIMFYANWCPHCTSMVQTWTALHKKHGSKYSVHAIDCASTDAANKEICSKFGVSGYPTIKLWHQGQLTDYNGGREFDDLEAALLKLSPPRMAQSGGGGKRRSSSRRRRISPRASHCTGKTSEGKACKRDAIHGKKRCWQHKH
jgi:thiol-disulfide isomerase/thioredoxin